MVNYCMIQVASQLHIQGWPVQHYCPRAATMNKLASYKRQTCLNINMSEMNYILKGVKDANLRHTLAFGIVKYLFLNNCIQLLVATPTIIIIN